VEISWKDGWVGALITGVLFEVGRFLIGLYLGRSRVASPYGAAGSLVLILLWIYYASIIFFFGAELTQTWGVFHGRRSQPEE
jgi:membrane protein